MPGCTSPVGSWFISSGRALSSRWRLRLFFICAGIDRRRRATLIACGAMTTMIVCAAATAALTKPPASGAERTRKVVPATLHSSVDVLLPIEISDGPTVCCGVERRACRSASSVDRVHLVVGCPVAARARGRRLVACSSSPQARHWRRRPRVGRQLEIASRHASDSRASFVSSRFRTLTSRWSSAAFDRSSCCRSQR